MEWITNTDFGMENTCVAVGEFDGLHRGHRRVIEHLVSLEGAPVLVCLPAPAGEARLTTDGEKRALLQGLGLAAVVTLPSATGSASERIREALCRLNAQAIVAGSTGAGVLEALPGDMACRRHRCDVVTEGGKPVCTQRIREALTEGNSQEASVLLGRPYTITGEVVHGKALGRTVGMPTANLAVPEDKLLPRHGVYATRALVEGQAVIGITNIGSRPTVDQDSRPSVETMLVDFHRDIYGKTVELELHHFVREIRRFPNLAAVREQVERDLGVAMERLGPG